MYKKIIGIICVILLIVGIGFFAQNTELFKGAIKIKFQKQEGEKVAANKKPQKQPKVKKVAPDKTLIPSKTIIPTPSVTLPGVLPVLLPQIIEATPQTSTMLATEKSQEEHKKILDLLATTKITLDEILTVVRSLPPSQVIYQQIPVPPQPPQPPQPLQQPEIPIPPAPSGPIVWWEFDEDSGNTAEDSSGNGNNGILNFYDKENFTSSTLSHSGMTAFIVNGNGSLEGWHTDSAEAGAYLKIDLGPDTAKEYRKARINASQSYNGVYDIQYSDDDSTWINAATGFNPNGTGWHEKVWNPMGKHRYWRLYLTNTPGGGAWLNALELYSTDITYVDGQIGEALRFDGLGDYVDSIIPITTATGASISAWVKPEKFPESGLSTILRLGPQSDTTGFHWAYFGPNTLYWQYTNGTAYQSISVPVKFAPGDQHHLVITHNYDKQEINFYRDGVLLSTQKHSDSILPPILQSIRIGIYDTDVHQMNGSIDDLRVYDRALNPSEIWSLYNSAKTAKTK